MCGSFFLLLSELTLDVLGGVLWSLRGITGGQRLSIRLNNLEHLRVNHNGELKEAGSVEEGGEQGEKQVK